MDLATQSYKNIEVIVVDDCSTEAHIPSVLGEFKREYPAIFKVTRLETNLGQGIARNVGI